MKAAELQVGQTVIHDDGRPYEVKNVKKGQIGDYWWFALKAAPTGDEPDYGWVAWNIPGNVEVTVV